MFLPKLSILLQWQSNLFIQEPTSGVQLEPIDWLNLTNTTRLTYPKISIILTCPVTSPVITWSPLIIMWPSPLSSFSVNKCLPFMEYKCNENLSWKKRIDDEIMWQYFYRPPWSWNKNVDIKFSVHDTFLEFQVCSKSKDWKGK